MSLFEPRCLVCGAPLGKGTPFEKDVRNSEVCSDKCCKIYMFNEDEFNQPNDTCAHRYVNDEGNCELCGEPHPILSDG